MDDIEFDELRLSAARTVAARGYLAAVRLRYLDGARFLEEAAARVPERFGIFADGYLADAMKMRISASRDEQRHNREVCK